MAQLKQKVPGSSSLLVSLEQLGEYKHLHHASLEHLEIPPLTSASDTRVSSKNEDSNEDTQHVSDVLSNKPSLQYSDDDDVTSQESMLDQLCTSVSASPASRSVGDISPFWLNAGQLGTWKTTASPITTSLLSSDTFSNGVYPYPYLPASLTSSPKPTTNATDFTNTYTECQDYRQRFVDEFLVGSKPQVHEHDACMTDVEINSVSTTDDDADFDEASTRQLKVDLSWLDDDDEFEQGVMKRLVGENIQILCTTGDKWINALVTAEVFERKHVVVYDDGDVHEVNLNNVMWRKGD